MPRTTSPNSILTVSPPKPKAQGRPQSRRARHDCAGNHTRSKAIFPTRLARNLSEAPNPTGQQSSRWKIICRLRDRGKINPSSPADNASRCVDPSESTTAKTGLILRSNGALSSSIPANVGKRTDAEKNPFAIRGKPAIAATRDMARPMVEVGAARRRTSDGES